MVQFPGFGPDDFDIFLIPDFHERMFHVRSRLRPKLAQLGDDVAPALQFSDHPLYPHTASHARRRINPPDDTWVAFSRSPRGYKRFAHFEIGIDRHQVFVRFVVKPEGSDDKPHLLAYLRQAGAGAFRLNDPEPIYWYRDDHGQSFEPIAHLDDQSVVAIADTAAKKSRGFAVGMVLARDNPIVASAQLVPKSINMINHLAPLYVHTVASEPAAAPHG